MNALAMLYGPFLVIFALFTAALTKPADLVANDLAVGNMNPLLTIHADAVVREYSMYFEYQEPGRGELHVRRVVTILNSEGRSHADISLRYDSFSRIGSIQAAMYDANGNRIRRYRNRDIDDNPAISNINFVDDARIKSFQMYHSSYPYTIELEYRYDYRGFINLPGFAPQTSERTSVENASFKVKLPVLQPFEFRTYNFAETEPSEDLRGGNRTLVWETSNLPAVRREPFSKAARDLVPLILIKSDQFSMDGKNGSLESWNNFGRWINELWSGRQQLTPATIERVEQIAASHDRPEDVILELYSYLQRNTRYVSVQLGIGGLQTETALFTDRNRYGDCKALTNMLKAMLDVAGIPSYPALIESGTFHREIDPEFPFNSFNHVILMVPLEQDTIWVESTSNHFPPGYIGRANHDRYTLVFSEDGGTLVRTPRLSPEQNFQKREAEIHILANGDASARVKTRYGGHQHESIRFVAGLSAGQQLQRLNNMISINRFEITNHLVEAAAVSDEAVILLEMDLPSFGRQMGNRLFLEPNLLEGPMRAVPAVENRTQSVHLTANYYDHDQLIYVIPENYRIEALPDNIHLETDFGLYVSSFVHEEDSNRVIYTREVRFEPGVFPADRYEEFRDFRNDIFRQDQPRIVLVQAD
ncbi:MAG: DUF3857 domain-containing transglutaminase family protein [Balneolales bacterium]|nr:DUF3857 domain-containing transglutaminase family protein [Balneolales bacterium]